MPASLPQSCPPPDRAADPCEVLGVIGEPLDGVGYVRFAQPFDHLADRGFRLRGLGSQLTFRRTARGFEADPLALLDGIDLLIFPQAVASPVLADGSRAHVVQPLCDEAARRGIRVVYSVDDYLPIIEKPNPDYDRVRDALPNVETILDACDAILVTTEPLRQALEPRGKPIHWLPNAIDPGRWTLRPGAGGEPRVGWAGSSSHLDDVLMVLPAIRRLQRRVPFRFVILGLVDMPLSQQVAQIRRHQTTFNEIQRATARRFLELAGQLRDIDHEHHPFVATERYFDALPRLDLDIGLCPLLDTPFNRHKSALKFYEYAVSGSLTLASDVTPYADEVSVTLPDDPQAWCDALARYLANPRDRQDEWNRQRDHVLRHRNIETLKFRWIEALHSILATPTQGASP